MCQATELRRRTEKSPKSVIFAALILEMYGLLPPSLRGCLAMKVTAAVIFRFKIFLVFRLRHRVRRRSEKCALYRPTVVDVQMA